MQVHQHRQNSIEIKVEIDIIMSMLLAFQMKISQELMKLKIRTKIKKIGIQMEDLAEVEP